MAQPPQSHDLKEQQRALWTENAAPWRRWRREMAQQSAAATELILQMVGVQPGQQVLDLASGTGEPALSLAAAVAPGGRVVATDIVPEMLEAIAEEALARKLTTLRVEPADMEALPFPDQSFDAVTCRFGIMFPADAERALREIHRVLRPGGRAALLVWGAPTQPFFATSMGAFMRRATLPPPPPGAPSVFRFSQPGSLGAAMRSTGFQAVDEATHSIRWSWPGTPEEVWAATSDIQAAFLLRLRDAMDQHQYAQAEAEALAGLHQYYDGTAVTMPAEVIGVAAQA